ncbi:MAG TPA: peptide chain release factor N(5)-glutamine methyltransferase [Marmoricola sp.]
MSNPRDLVRIAAERLRAAGVASAEFDAAELLAHVLGITRPQLGLVSEMSEEDRATFDALVARRASREPLQHLIGTAWFRYITVEVGPGVFVPRPETELLAGWAIEQCGTLVEERAPRNRALVVDLCTGSGAIAKSIAHEASTATVYAVEMDPVAHEWATRNLEGTGVDLRLGDMATAFPALDGAVDVVVCNPPYIPLEAWESVAVEARDHDPATALWSGEDGLDAMRVLERAAARLLRPGGVVGAEHADAQGVSAPGVFTGTGRWADVRDHLDLAGRPRFLTARLAP